MRKIILFTLWIVLLGSPLVAQDFQCEITFTPSHDPNQAKTRIFAGHSTSSDNYDSDDIMGPPPGQTYYVYFSINEFPRYLWTDSRQWISPYDKDKKWNIIITNATDITTTITWKPAILPSIPGRRFILNGADGSPINMNEINSATVTGNAQLTIEYTSVLIQHTLILAVNPEGGGTTDPPVGTYTHDEGRVISISAVSAKGYRFSHWTGDVADSTQPNTTITMDGDKTIIANFVLEEYTLTVSVQGNGSVIRNPDKSFYNFNEVVQLTAIPEPGWLFTGWSGDVADTNNQVSVTITDNMNVIAQFTEARYTITVTLEGNGSVSKNPDQLTYKYNDVVSLTATPDPGWSFNCWTGDMYCGNNTKSITITSVMSS